MLIRTPKKLFRYRIQLLINYLDFLYEVLHHQYGFFVVLGFLAFLGGRYEELLLVAKREHPRLLGG